MSSHWQGHNPYISTKKSTHYKRDNPFTAPENQQKFDATLKECNQINQTGNTPSKQQPNNTNKNPVPFDPCNPYLNDPNLQAAMEQFSPFKNKQYEQAHSARSNGYNNQNNHNNNNNNKNTAKSQHSEANKITITSDNPYHPTNYYKDQEEEQKTAKHIVNQYRVDEIKRDCVVDEYTAFLKTLPTMNMINEEVNNNNNNNNYNYNNNNNNCKYKNKTISPSNSIASNDMIPGQIAINTSNFNELCENDTVWIRNDDTGDWEIYTVIKMEKTNVDRNNAYICTFKMGNKKRVIWQDQCRDFAMAKFKKEKDNNNNIVSPTSKYVINNIFKINGDGFNGNFVLKKYDQFSGVASMKDVRTGNMVDINLNQVQHVMV